MEVIILGQSHEQRTTHLANSWKNKFAGECYCVNYNIDNQGYNLDKIGLKDYKTYKSTPNKNLVQSLEEDLMNVLSEKKNILIDITSLKQPFFFYLLKLLKRSFRLNKIFASYTQPLQYVSQDESTSYDYTLSEEFRGIRSLPGFAIKANYKKKKVLVATLGFEGKRFKRVYNEIGPNNEDVHVITGFPPFSPGWQYISYTSNMDMLQSTTAFHQMYRATAYEPFSILNTLNDIKSTNLGCEIVLAPIGTKPHALGAALFAIKNEDVRFIYDYPVVGKNTRTVSIGNSYLYDITESLYG